MPKVLWLSGEVVAARSITVASRIEGYIHTVLANEGDRVAKGQLLVEIDPSGVEAGIARAEADIVAARASLADANADVERFRKLAKTQVLAEDRLRDARVRAVTERAALASAEALLRSRVAEREYVKLAAPEDATVVRRLLEPGDLAKAGASILLLDSRAPHELEVFVPAARIRSIEPGKTLTVELDQGGELNARVLSIVPSADHHSRQVKVRLALPPESPTLPGTYGRARLIVDQAHSPAVPGSAIISRAGVEGVFVADGGSRARFRSVHLGQLIGAFREVLAGVTPGDLVVITPSSRLRDGDRINRK